MNNCLLIFAKYPEPGRVKTRLANKIGPERAALLYKEMVETVMQKTIPQDGEYERCLCFDPPERHHEFFSWFPFLEKMRPQSDGDLGRRLETAVRDSLQTGTAKTVVIGTDCVDLDRTLILDAFHRLSDADLVIGPARDGGYYLVGMKKLYDLFTGIPWSTDRVFAETIRRADAFHLKIAVLPTLSDIDEIP